MAQRDPFKSWLTRLPCPVSHPPAHTGDTLICLVFAALGGQLQEARGHGHSLLSRARVTLGTQAVFNEHSLKEGGETLTHAQVNRALERMKVISCVKGLKGNKYIQDQNKQKLPSKLNSPRNHK